ncbi:hypothetical protein KP509_18G005700 [Ceratopteris richardii]|nr:hypothetical protein KP509_18G005700 [Ceratopteris richardii]
MVSVAPLSISRANFAPHCKVRPLPVLRTEVVVVEASCVLAQRIAHFFTEIVSKNEVDDGLVTDSSDVLLDQRSSVSRRILSMTLLSNLFISTPFALADTEKKNMGKKSPFNEQRLLEQNKRMQALNNAPADFPGFVREGYNVKLVTTEQYKKTDSGLIYLDIQEGHGDYPKNGQQITFHYIGYNESGRRVDSSYQQGQPAKTRIGINAMIPGFEEGLRTMRAGGKRRLIIPPELGPPVGPSTFFSAKQFEVFDVELLDVKDCTRRTIGFYSDFVCD